MSRLIFAAPGLVTLLISKVLVLFNKSAKVEKLGKYLASKGVPNVALTSTADARKRGNNHHINSFLRTPNSSKDLAKPERTGRAGARGTVVIFGKTKGRDVKKYKEFLHSAAFGNNVKPIVRLLMDSHPPPLARIMQLKALRAGSKDVADPRGQFLEGSVQAREKWAAVKQINKQRMAAHVEQSFKLGLDTHAMVDVQIRDNTPKEDAGETKNIPAYA
ncbi:hypothetical protein BC835DRAFT_1310091 [Cytidiella melzeri]|nr:hypothetical protein BC835DRAFT_1310091 [Cytidiella melzeri]